MPNQIILSGLRTGLVKTRVQGWLGQKENMGFGKFVNFYVTPFHPPILLINPYHWLRTFHSSPQPLKPQALSGPPIPLFSPHNSTSATYFIIQVFISQEIDLTNLLNTYKYIITTIAKNRITLHSCFIKSNNSDRGQ